MGRSGEAGSEPPGSATLPQVLGRLSRNAVHAMPALSSETLLLLALYVALGGAYLLVIPGLLMGWMNRRWHVMGKIERLVIYGMVFLFFPGLALLAPLLNLRLQGRRPG